MIGRSFLMVFGLAVFFAVSAVITSDACAAPAVRRKVWSIREIMKARDLQSSDVRSPKYCQGGRFQPCVCAKDVSKAAQYRPAVRECRGKAAVILSRKYLGAFSAVVRDKENKDRWPPQGINGCSAYERDVLALNKCSAFKAQKVIGVEDDEADAYVHCLGASGYSSLFRRVSRITIKLADLPGSTNDPLARLCLVGPAKPLN